MSRQLILAHDLGTSGDKACLFDESGSFLAEAYYTYDTFYPKEGYAEHDPNAWWEAVANSTKDVMRSTKTDPSDVKAISFSAHGMGVIPVDKNGKLLVDRVMVWMDARSTKEAAYITEKSGDREHYEKTGNSFDLALYPAAKILWLKRNMPDVYKKTYKFLSTKEYLIQKMTGKIGFTDYGEAGMSGLYNLNTHSWDPELMAISEVDEDKLLTPCDGTKVMGELTAEAAETMGLAKGTQVVLGSWDNYACATGGGVRKNGQMVAYLGTAGWMGINHGKPLMSKDFKSNVVYVGNDTYFTSAHSHSAASSYEWVLENMCTNLKQHDNKYQAAEELAKQIAPGSEKLFFMPSMFSGNTFYSDSSLCASFVGLKMMHGEGHVIRAALEGVGFDLMMGADFYKKMGAMPKSANLIGGGAKSDLWRQILASMFGIQIARPKSLQHIGALGAALMAGVGTGIIKDFDVAAEICKSDDIADPIAEQTAVYEELLPIYMKFYEQLIPAYKALQSI
ncbi:MAG: FGGY family carbohydrate kinase [Eubacteriales bacterium]